jgi:hypothetical protein
LGVQQRGCKAATDRHQLLCRPDAQLIDVWSAWCDAVRSCCGWSRPRRTTYVHMEEMEGRSWVGPVLPHRPSAASCCSTRACTGVHRHDYTGRHTACRSQGSPSPFAQTGSHSPLGGPPRDLLTPRHMNGVACCWLRIHLGDGGREIREAFGTRQDSGAPRTRRQAQPGHGTHGPPSGRHAAGLLLHHHAGRHVEVGR